MSTHNIDIQVREDGSRVVKRNIDGIGASADSATRNLYLLERSLRTLRNAMGAVAGGLFLNELRQYADEWIAIKNNIALSTKTKDQATAVEERLFAVAQKTRQEMSATVQLYRRSAQAQQALGASQNQMIDFTEGVGMALVIQGTSAKSAQGALLQLGQTIGMARVRAQEFNSINENAPRILQAVANNIEGTGGTIQGLRQEMLKGKISGKEFFDAFMKDMPRLQAEFEKARPTISQAFTTLDNAIGRFIAQSDEAVGASTKIARGIVWIAENLNDLAKVFGVVAAGALVAMWPVLLGWISKAIGAIKLLWAAMLSNPITAIIAGVAAIITALTLWRDEIIILSDYGISLGDYFRAAWSYIVEGVQSVIEWFKNLNVNVGDTASSIVAAFVQAGRDIFNVMKWSMNSIIGLFLFLAKAGPIIFERLPGAIEDLFVQGLNSTLESAEKWANKMVAVINKIRAHFGKDLIPEVSLERMKNRATGAASDFGSAMSAAWQESLNTDYLGNIAQGVIDWGSGMLDQLTARAHIFALKRRDEQEAVGAGGLDESPGSGVPSAAGEDAAKKAMKKLKDELDGIYRTVDPVMYAIKEFAEAEEILNKAVASGLIDMDEKNRLMGLLRDHYNDAYAPLSKLNEEMEKEAKLLRFTGKEREIETELLRLTEQLKQAGNVLTKEETDTLRDQLKVMYELNQVAAARDEFYQNVHGPQERLITGQKALNQLLEEGKINLQEYNIQLAKLRLEVGDGTFLDGFMNQLGVLDEAMANWTAQFGQQFATMTQTMIDGMADATAQALVYGETWEDKVGEAANAALAQLISGLVKVGLQMLLNWALGETMGKASAASSAATAASTAAAWAPAAAMASLASFGANSAPAMAGIAATTALAQSLAMIPGFRTGGEFTVGGSGGADSQLVAFRATPGENVQVNTPAQARAKEQSGGNVTVPVRVVNVLDPAVALSAMQTSEGERIILNTIENNPSIIRAALGG